MTLKRASSPLRSDETVPSPAGTTNRQRPQDAVASGRPSVVRAVGQALDVRLALDNALKSSIRAILRCSSFRMMFR